ncbi:excalibur calcium-binding domain-containing protein [Terribacillus saccharophilus]|uniref:excalibur calcium-binding domain-containing protein n=1 Tax=Terribacillus saccharophilus TaxID=361277 RepID=UPI0005719F33|nr:excalibur calcium-binding domain-containing protein [Terribacillus goriensis]
MLALALIFLALFLAALIFLVLGLINPRFAFFKRRRHILYIYPGAILLFFFCMITFTFSWSVTSDGNATLATQNDADADLQQKLDTLTTEKDELQNQLDASAQEVKDLTSTISDLKKKNDDLNQDAKESGKNKETLETNIEKLEKEKDTLQGDLDSEKEKNSTLTTQLSNAEDEIDNLESKATTSVQTASSSNENTYEEESNDTAATSVYFDNCTAAKAAGAAPVSEGDPGYGRHLDRDGDGIGCEW